jgi:putative endonuclease
MFKHLIHIVLFTFKSMKKGQRKTFVYIVECCDGSYYTGLTINVERRLEQHNSGRGARYTSSHLPVKLIYLESLASLSDALKRERHIKRLRRMEKEAIVKGGRRLPKKFRV